MHGIEFQVQSREILMLFPIRSAEDSRFVWVFEHGGGGAAVAFPAPRDSLQGLRLRVEKSSILGSRLGCGLRLR